MFGTDEEDTDFLSPTGGAKLASLFGLDQEVSQGNQSFQYTAPKQPRKASNTSAPANQKAAPPGGPSVLLAAAVQAFRYTNGQYVKQGKLGAAVLGCHTTREYKLLLYLSQQKQVASARIHAGFVLTVQPNNYCSFYDDQRQNWSLMFETEKTAADFYREVCVSRASSCPSLEDVLIQDLVPGDGQPVDNGDTLEVVYSAWTLEDNTLGQMFDSNQNKDKLLRLKMGAGKVIKGWERGMLGMKKSCRRLIIVPPSLAYGSKGVASRVPANSTLAFETELRRVKFCKDGGCSEVTSVAGSRDSAPPSPSPSVDSVSPETPVQPVQPVTSSSSSSSSGPARPGEAPLRAKSNSLSEQLANPDSTKAQLISRMARMGQPMFPLMATTQPESSDSELEDSGSRAKERLAAASPLHIASHHPPPPHHPQPSSSNAVLPVVNVFSAPPHATQHAFQPYPVAPSTLQPAFPAQTVTYAGSADVTTFLMTEARQHSTEIRLAVAKVADKVETLATKVDDLQRQSSSVGGANISMETSMIMHNIQRIIQENESLKKEVFEKSCRIEEQNRKIGDLLNQNQRCVEQSHLLMEQRNDSLKSTSEQNQNRLLQAEQDKARLTEDLASSASRVVDLQQRVAELQSQLSAALLDAQRTQQDANALNTQLAELKEAAEQALTQHRSEKQRRKELESRISVVEEELQDVRSDKESLERTLSERKRQWAEERRRREEELEELRRSSQQEVEDLRAQLNSMRSSKDGPASDQVGELQEVKGQRDALQDELRRLQEEYDALQKEGARGKERGEEEGRTETAAEVKRVMNGVFRSLRGQFEVNETYSGDAVLALIVNTIKNVTLELLSGGAERQREKEEKEVKKEEKDEEEVKKEVKQKVSQIQQVVNGRREEEEHMKEKKDEEEERRAKEEEQRAKEEEEERRAKEEEQRAKEGERRAKEEEERRAKEEKGNVKEEQEERNTKEEEKRKAKEEKRNAKKEEERRAKEEEERRAKEEEEERKEEQMSSISKNSVDQTQKAESIKEEEEKEEEQEEKILLPPSNPPPPPPASPPPAPQAGHGSLSGTRDENEEESFFQNISPAKAPPPTEEEEEEEEEMSLKGGPPPPAPLFADEDDDEDLDWLN